MTTFKELKEKEREARRNLIISAAQRLFSEKDFRKVTAREIAKEAGVSSGTIYRYYKNMDELFIDIFLSHASEINRLIEEELAASKPLSIHRYCELHVHYLNENMTFYQMMSHFMLGGGLPSETSLKMDPIMRTWMNNLERILIRSGFREDTRIASHAIFASLNGLMISYAKYPGRSLEEIKKHTLKLAKTIADRFC
ncbi:TetR/AcrR family transcriptional regulator [bacterium]|nr:TetR/AcrR family transcriptional regulator [bacterium]